MGKKLKQLLSIFGPGWITGASDDDPAGIGTYSYSGSRFGLDQIWTMLFIFPFMVAVQELCGRIGQASGTGLMGAMRRHHSKPVLYFCITLLLLANTFNIGADIGLMAASMKLVIDLPLIFWALLFTVVTLALEIFVSYAVYSRYLKWLTVSLIAYVITAFVARPDWPTVLDHLVYPTITFSGEFMFVLVGILGTTISPYLFFWQTAMEVEEERLQGRTTIKSRKGATDVEMKAMRIDIFAGMFFSNMVAFFIMLTTATTLFKNHVVINTAADAAAALAPIAGPFASYLFAVGVVATGLLAVPVLAGSASYAVAEVLGWRGGLYKKLHEAHGFYGVITIATLIGLMINFIGIDPVQALVWSAVLNGVVSPILLTFIIQVGNNKSIMGKWCSGGLSRLFTYSTVAIMSAAAVLMFVFWQ